jgi:hypothetical protein
MQKWVLKIDKEIMFEKWFSDRSIKISKLSTLLTHFCNEENVNYITFIGDWIDD